MIIKLFSQAQQGIMQSTTTLHSGSVSEFWRSWNIRIFVFLSFFLQGFLIIGAAFRKQRANRALIGLIWLAYVLADWAAYYALGLISNSESYCTTTTIGNLHGFWAPFLLLHLGGPATITAFSLGDTTLWYRSALNLVVQAAATVLALIELLPNNDTEILAASILVFTAAIVRYSDRVISLYIASTTRSTTTSPPHKIATASTTLEAVAEAEPWGELSEEVETGRDAYSFFETYKRLYGDRFLTFTGEEQADSKAFFSGLTAQKAFSLMEIELSLAYEVFYTKISLIQRWIERILYPFSTICVIAALVVWIIADKDDYNTIDIVITYALLIGAILVDAFSAVVILFSDWMIAYLITSNKVRYFTRLIKALVTFRKRRWISLKRRIGEPSHFWSSMFARIFFPHWSESIMQLNLIEVCLNDRSKFNIIMKYYEIMGYPTNPNLYKVQFTSELRDFIFREIKERGESDLALGSSEQICSRNAKWTLKKCYNRPNPFSVAFNGLEYDEILLVLHIATDLCFRTSAKGETSRDFSKVLSDYMFYLLVLQQNMVFVPGSVWQNLFSDTCTEIKRIASEIPIESSGGKFDELVSERFMEVGARSENKVVRRGCCLAARLGRRENPRWEIVSGVWAELACHAAVHSRGSAHGDQLSRGGELLSFVWLMLAHLKIGKQFIYREEDDGEGDGLAGKVPESPSTGGEDNWPFEST